MPRSQDRLNETLAVRCACPISSAYELFFRLGVVQSCFSIFMICNRTLLDTAAPGILFLSRSHKVVIQAIIDGLQAGQECITLLGEPGLGKTFLLHAALAHSDLQHLKAISIFDPRLSAYDILKMACEELECDGVTQEAEQLTASFYHALLAEHERGRQVVLILDEADTIPRETLEYSWGAHRRAATGKPLLQIILAGLRAFWQHGNGVLLQSFKKDLVTCVTLAFSPIGRAWTTSIIVCCMLVPVQTRFSPQRPWGRSRDTRVGIRAS